MHERPSAADHSAERDLQEGKRRSSADSAGSTSGSERPTANRDAVALAVPEHDSPRVWLTYQASAAPAERTRARRLLQTGVRRLCAV